MLDMWHSIIMIPKLNWYDGSWLTQCNGDLVVKIICYVDRLLDVPMLLDLKSNLCLIKHYSCKSMVEFTYR